LDSLRGDPRFEKSSPISRRRRQPPNNAAARIEFFPLQSSNIVSRLKLEAQAIQKAFTAPSPFP
jgi:hypothetical protein